MPATRTPDPDDTPTTPPGIQRSKSGREIKQPAYLSQEQEIDNQNKTTHPKHKKNGPATTLRRNTLAETTNPNPNANCNEITTQRLLQEVKGLREELLQRDTEHQQELQRLHEALATTQRELEEIKVQVTRTHSSTCSRNGHSEIIQELQSLQSAITTPTTVSDYPSWAAVVANGNKAQAAPGSALPGDRKRQTRETNCIRISTQRGEAALANTPATQDTQVLGVGVTRTGYLIRFRDEDQADTARSNTKWLGELGNNTKLVQPRFGVVVHRTPTEELISLQDDDVRIHKSWRKMRWDCMDFKSVKLPGSGKTKRTPLENMDRSGSGSTAARPQNGYWTMACWSDAPILAAWYPSK
ncbi:hypothetical protein DPV78_011727 [Talaromyces pinophilus]|nr:hypothetical protein DPV78_011727 [Talaromyces pinophilus]